MKMQPKKRQPPA